MRGIPCDKLKIGELSWTMLKSKQAFLLGDDQIKEYRLWLALTPHFMSGLPDNDTAMIASRSSARDGVDDVAKDFLATYHFKTPKDEEGPKGSGMTPLFLASMVGNHAVAAGLIAQGADVHCKTRKFSIRIGSDAGATALHVALAFCPTRQTEMVTLLLRAGADANAPSKSGYTPLMSGVVAHNMACVKALLHCAKDIIEFECGTSINGSTALGICAYTGTPEICEMLIKAGASLVHINDRGGTKLHDACCNVATTKVMLDLIWNDGQLDINATRRSKTVFWRLVDQYFRRGMKYGYIRKSFFAMEMAHDEGSTPLHHAAKSGLIDVTVWLLDHGAHKSLRVRNKMGATPLDLARIFGPFPAIETKLGSAMLNHDFNTQFAIRRGSLLRRRAGGSVVEPEPDNDAPTTPLQSDARPAEPTRMETTVQAINEPGTGGDSAPTVDTAGTHAVPTTAVGGTREFEDRSSAVDGGVSLTLLSSGVDARFDEQAAHFYEQGTRIDTRFDEQAARMDAINARFDSLQADNTRLQAQLHVQNAKLDALLSSATAAHSPPAK